MYRMQEPQSPSLKEINDVKSINIWLSLFILINGVVGTAFLGVPYAFFHTGLIAGVATCVLVSFVCWSCSVWTLETMARAQVVYEYQQQPQGSENEEQSDTLQQPYFRIDITRKFEPSEQCEIFLRRWLKIVYLVILTLTGFIGCVSFCTVAGTAWAVNIPLNFSGVEQCDDTDFLNQLLPTDTTCRNGYWFCLFLFACIVVPLSLLELKEQLIVHIIIGCLRYITIGAIVLFSLGNIIKNGDICSCNDPWANATLSDIDDDCNINTTISDIALRFDAKSWLVTIPLLVYGFLVPPILPSLTHPVREKHHLRSYINILFVITTCIYILVGVSVPLWFRDCIIETSTLNWASLITYEDIALKVLSYYVILYPSVAVIPVYPLIVLILVNNLYSVLCCQDTSQSRRTWTNSLTRLIMKFTVAVAPILVAMAVSNLATVLKYAGLLGFFTCFFFPTLLQLRSQWVCKKLFTVHTVNEPPITASAATDPNALPLMSEDTNVDLEVNKDKISKRGRELYMTPYSTVCSHWPVVLCIGAASVALFVLTIISLFVDLF